MSNNDYPVTRAEFNTLKVQVDELKTDRAVSAVHHSNVETRLTSIEGTLTWLVRLVIGALILALIAYATGGGLAIV